jgi:hypothetical protein
LARLEELRKRFYDPQVQAKLEENLQKISDPLFIVSECLVDESNESEVGE